MGCGASAVEPDDYADRLAKLEEQIAALQEHAINASSKSPAIEGLQAGSRVDRLVQRPVFVHTSTV